jgi:hypothetical protein
MKLLFFYTSQLTEIQWESYKNSFNHVFQRNFSVQNFKDKYVNNSGSESYHGLIIDGDTVIGGCTAIPWSYNYFDEEMQFALLVDVFVHENYRKNEFILYDAYLLVKEKLKEDSIPFILSVPNAIAYPFWNKIARFKDIGIIPWYVLPIKFGNVLKKSKFWNASYILVLIYAIFNRIISFIFRTKSHSKIHIKMDDAFRKNRFSSHEYIQLGHTAFYYRIFTEDGVRAGYLFNESTFNYAGLSKAIVTLILKDKVDIIIYIGKMNIAQLSLFKLPLKRQPRKFTFCGCEVIKDVVNPSIYNYENWDFGLLNFDVR